MVLERREVRRRKKKKKKKTMDDDDDVIINDNKSTLWRIPSRRAGLRTSRGDGRMARTTQE